MSAQIIPFRRPTQEAEIIVELPASFLAALPDPANTVTVDAVPVDAHAAGNTIVSASMALSLACREMAASLSLLVAHCESADSLMADISGGAQSIALGGDAIGQAAACLSSDMGRGARALAMAAAAGAKI